MCVFVSLYLKLLKKGKIDNDNSCVCLLILYDKRKKTNAQML